MSKVTSLQERSSAKQRYDQRLEETRQRLEAAADALETDLVNLAMFGPWRAWSEEQQVGAIQRIGPKMLAETGDPVITRLTALLVALYETLDELPRRVSDS